MVMLDRRRFRPVKESRVDHAPRRKHPGPHADETTVKSRYPALYRTSNRVLCESSPHHRIASNPTLLIPFLDKFHHPLIGHPGPRVAVLPERYVINEFLNCSSAAFSDSDGYSHRCWAMHFLHLSSPSALFSCPLNVYVRGVPRGNAYHRARSLKRVSTQRPGDWWDYSIPNNHPRRPSSD